MYTMHVEGLICKIKFSRDKNISPIDRFMLVNYELIHKMKFGWNLEKVYVS